MAFWRKYERKYDRFQTQKYIRVHYSNIGIFSASKTYTTIFEPFQYLQAKPPKTIEFTELQEPTIKQVKHNDLKSFMKFLSPKEKDWFENNIFLVDNIQNYDVENEKIYSDDDYEDE